MLESKWFSRKPASNLTSIISISQPQTHPTPVQLCILYYKCWAHDMNVCVFLCPLLSLFRGLQIWFVKLISPQLTIVFNGSVLTIVLNSIVLYIYLILFFGINIWGDVFELMICFIVLCFFSNHFSKTITPSSSIKWKWKHVSFKLS